MDRLHLLICYSVQFLILEFMRQTCHDWFLMLYCFWLENRFIRESGTYWRVCLVAISSLEVLAFWSMLGLLFYSSIILNQNTCSVNYLIKHLFAFLFSHSPILSAVGCYFTAPCCLCSVAWVYNSTELLSCQHIFMIIIIKLSFFFYDNYWIVFTYI